MSPSHILLVVVATVAIVASQTGLSEIRRDIVICVGSDGHVAVESSFGGECCDDGAAELRASETMELSTADGRTTHCGDCVDHPIRLGGSCGPAADVRARSGAEFDRAAPELSYHTALAEPPVSESTVQNCGSPPDATRTRVLLLI